MKNRTYEAAASYQNGVWRMVLVGISFILEVGFWWILIARLNAYASWIEIATRVIGLLVVLALYSTNRTASLKMPWIMLIMAFPVFGLFLYCVKGLSIQTRKMRRKYENINKELMPLLPKNEDVLQELKSFDPASASIACYLQKNTGFPLYHDSDIEYYASTTDALEAQLAALSNAQKFIFMEYHAIEPAASWKRIEEVLVSRVKAGVEVRVFYDDIGSIGFVSTDFSKALEKKGIRCVVFNPFRVGFNMFLNNRDHRKITVVDGKIGFTGGYNLADEYFNLTKPYGDWKDAGVKLTGPAVKSLTASFLEMWNATVKDHSDDYSKYLPEIPGKSYSNAFIAPFSDNPMDRLRVGEDVYLNMIAKANEYCWFVTPYLILSDELISALKEAAMRGVDVRIVTPGIPDKRMVYQLTRSFYPPLMDCGVTIYEWTPGFCHAKLCVVDDKMAFCGTINLDYRSLYHHFENGCFFCHSTAVLKMKQDLEQLFSKSKNVTEIYREKKRRFLSFGQLVLRLFAGLM